MKKTAAVLSFLSSMAIGMEENKLSMSSSPYSGRAKGYVPQKITELRAARKKLAAKVEVSENSRRGVCEDLRVFTEAEQKKNGLIKWRLCCHYGFSSYNLSFLVYRGPSAAEETPFERHLFLEGISRGVCIDGCGLLGILVAVPDLKNDIKSKIINYLMLNNEFQLTKKDLNFTYFDLWERTQEESTRKALLCFGNKDKNSMLSWLSLDLIKLIAQCIEPVEKPLLPRDFFENGVIKMQSIEEEE